MPLVTKPEVKNHLNIPESETKFDTELDIFINAALPKVEYIIGPIEARTLTEIYHVCGRSQLILTTVPVLSVTTVTEYLGGQAHVLANEPPSTTSPTLYGYYLENAQSGLIRRRSYGYNATFLGHEVVVTYQAGRASVPADVKLAALDDIRALFQQTQTAARPQFGGGGVVMGPDRWGGPEDLHMFPRLASLLQSQQFQVGIA